MADYHLEDIVYELNYESAKIAREVADAFTAKTRISPDLLRFHRDQQTERQACRQT
jgi:5-methyltetrahydrofolate--homocysteine methyltransferase